MGKHHRKAKSDNHLLFWFFPLLYGTTLAALLWVAADYLLQKALPAAEQLLAMASGL